MYCRAENQCHCCGIYHFQRPDLIRETPASNPASLLLTRFPGSREKRAVRTSIVKLQAHTEKGTSPRDLSYVAKANITPDEEFKTEIHSIKREVERKFIGALTKFHYCRVEPNNDKL